VSDENEKLIEETFITKLGAKHPWVKAKGCNDKYGIQGFPTTVVIGPDGTIKSNDRTPSEADIEAMLKEVVLPPEVPEGPQYAPLRTMWEKREYGKLRDWLDKTLAQPAVEPAMKEVCEAQKAELTKLADVQAARAAKLGEGPDYVASTDALEKLEKTWKGFPAADAARKELTRFGADATIKKEVGAGRALQKLLAGFDTNKESDVKKLVAELPKFAKKYEGTYAGKQAEERRKKLLGHD